MSKPTKAQVKRFERMKMLGCIACRKYGVLMYCGPIEAHHLLSGGMRRGHSETVPLGRFHHRGMPLDGKTTKQMTEYFGPSLRLESKRFHEVFGDDSSLLAETNALLENQ